MHETPGQHRVHALQRERVKDQDHAVFAHPGFAIGELGDKAAVPHAPRIHLTLNFADEAVDGDSEQGFLETCQV